MLQNLLKSKQQTCDKSFIHLLSSKQEAKNNIGQLRPMEESDTARSGQFTFLVSAMVFMSVPPIEYCMSFFLN